MFPENFGKELNCSLVISKKNFFLIWQCWDLHFTCVLHRLLFSKHVFISSALGLHCCTAGFLYCGEQGLLSSGSAWFLTAVASLVAEHRSRAQAQQLWHTGLAAPWCVGSSWTRDRTCVSCIGRWILNHWTTRAASKQVTFFFFFKLIWQVFLVLWLICQTLHIQC